MFRIEKLRDNINKIFVSRNNPLKLLIDDNSKSVLFNYPKLTKDNVKLRIDNHNIFPKNEIYNLTKYLLEYKKGNVRCIHPYYLMLSWDEIKDLFNVIECESSNAVELRPKDKDTISWRIQTRETLKIIEQILNNDIFKRYFYDYYHYLILLGTKIEVHNYFSGGNQQYTCDLELSFSKKSKVVIEINEEHHNEENDLTRARNFLCEHHSYPILYYPEKEDMTNVMPKIWKEVAYAIAKDNLEDGVRLYLILVDGLSPVFVNFIMSQYKKDTISVLEIIEFLEEQGMKKPHREIKRMINDEILDDEITWTKKDLSDAKITPLGMDLIFMRINPAKFNKAIALSKQYHIIKTKYLDLIQKMVSHNLEHLKILQEGYLDVATKLNSIKNTKHQLPDLCSILYQSCKDKIPEEIQSKLHPKYPFLVKEEGTNTLKNEWKKITKKDYHSAEEESKKYIVNHRFITNEDLKEIKESLGDDLINDSEDDFISFKKDTYLKNKITVKITNTKKSKDKYV